MMDYNGEILDKADSFHEPPGHGCGQENGEDPNLWVLTSTPLLQIFQADGFEAELCGAQSLTYVVFVAFTFANNMDLIEAAKLYWELINHVAYQMKQDVDMWGGMIRATSRASVP